MCPPRVMPLSSEGSSSRSVFLYGDFRFDRLAASYRRGFRDAGWRVRACSIGERDNYLRWWLTYRLTHRLTIRSRMLREFGGGRWTEEVVRRTVEAEPDLILVIGGEFLIPDQLHRLSEDVAPTMVLFPDDPFPESSNHRPEYSGIAKAADACWIWSKSLVNELEERWGAAAHYLPFAWDPVVFPVVSLDRDTARHEVTFIGGWDRWRERWLEPVADNFDLKIWGPDYWGRRTRSAAVRRCWQGGAVRGSEAAKVVADSAVVLNIFREQNLPDGTNMRTFEVPGTGGFLLSHRSDGATEIYPEEVAGAYFETMEEMLDQLELYLSLPDRREEIARAAHELTRQRHRYVDRVRRLVRAAGPSHLSGG